MAVIEACRQGGQWALAVALLREMSTTPIEVQDMAAAAATTTTTTMMSPTVEAYTAALTACGNAGQWEVAVGLLREVTDGDAVAATAAAANDTAGTAAEGQEEEEEDAGGDSEAGGDAGRRRKSAAAAAAGFRPVPLKPDLFLYNAAIEACGNAGQWQRALELLSEISEIGLSPSVVSPRDFRLGVGRLLFLSRVERSPALSGGVSRTCVVLETVKRRSFGGPFWLKRLKRPATRLNFSNLLI